MDSPGVLPSQLADQGAARHLAMCNDIGEASYSPSKIAACLVEEMAELPRSRRLLEALGRRYGGARLGGSMSGEEYLVQVADAMFEGDLDNAGRRLLRDFRKGALTWFALEVP